MQRLKITFFSIFTTIIFLTVGCSSLNKTPKRSNVSALMQAKLFADLPDNCVTPDAFDVSPRGQLTLSCPNYARSMSGTLVNVSDLGEVTEIEFLSSELRPVRPMGIAYAPDGSLFIADNVGNDQGRLIRVFFDKNGVISQSEIVAEGLTSPNGVRYHNGYIYLTQPQLPKAKSKHMLSGIYRFKITDRNIQIPSDGSSNHVLFIAKTKNPTRQLGLDGLVFDKEGSLYASNLGDAIIYKLRFNADGEISQVINFAQLPKNIGPDGINIDGTGNFYVAGFLTNEIYMVDTIGNVKLIAKYPDNSGANGGIDQPADLIVYKNKLIISNFDLMSGQGIVNKGHSKPYTLSYIEL